MNPEGPLVPQSNILPEFNPQMVGRKGFELIRREKRSDCLRSFSTECFCLRSIPWNNFRERTLKKRRELSPQFLSLVNSLASTNKTVNGYTLSQLFRSKNLEKTFFFRM